ncbi:MAG TPA: hypothetical protein VM657_03500 [Sphingomonas sp.]|nr:hypothetical protein [Sphingomonas sp.]
MESARAVRIEAPPQRYRVVERDRRLHVIDTWAQGGTPAPTRLPPAEPRAAGLDRINFGGAATLTTRSWYDLKGPRTLTLDPGAAALVSRARLVGIALAAVFMLAVIWMPTLLVLLALLFQPKNWKNARARATAWLDRFEPG